MPPFPPRHIVPAASTLPNRLVLLPLTGKPIFPGILTPLVASPGAQTATVNAALELGGFIGLVLTRDPDDDKPAPDRLHEVGTAAKVVRKINLPDGGLNVFISTITRFRIAKIMDPGPPLVAATQHLDDTNLDSDEVHALARALISEMKQVSEGNPLFSEEMRLNMVNIDQPGKIADFLASILNIERQQQQHILEQLDVRERMEQVLVFIKKEQELLKIQKRIQGELEEKISKSQRQYFLKEQLKAIKAELGMAVDAKSDEYQRFKEAFEALRLDGEAAERVSDELEKFALMDPSSAEFVVTRNYLETIATLPWAEPEPDRIDLKRAAAALDADHYGLDDVKERTLEYLAVRKLNPSSRGSILGLVGPPGVGKTSIGRSIARALGREFFRFSVGGMRDEAEIKGHRRTYVGAMPGKIIQGLRIVKTRNPVFMIDEIDKLGMSFQGDPSSALLEVLDPEQNAAFRDHYLDLPFNISEVLFIATANTLDTIPAPLLDRMEMIHLSGYIDTEKLEIARRFIIPKSIARAGLPRGSVRYRRNALLTIADGYAREAGVRNFEKALDKIHRKIARTVVETDPDPGNGHGDGAPLVIDRDRVGDYLGKPIFRDHDRRRTMRPGTATGLAWTPLGGAVLTVEALGTRGRGGFKLTGQLGDVMQESASIAYSWTRQAARRLRIDDVFFDEQQIHMHIPAGATKKDGPSAGITMAAALLSLACGKRLPRSLAMTGELSLVGDVLPIGGLKEKVIAAHRNRIREIIIPRANEVDIEDIPERLRRGISFHPVGTMEQVVEIIL